MEQNSSFSGTMEAKTISKNGKKLMNSISKHLKAIVMIVAFGLSFTTINAQSIVGTVKDYFYPRRESKQTPIIVSLYKLRTGRVMTYNFAADDENTLFTRLYTSEYAYIGSEIAEEVSLTEIIGNEVIQTGKIINGFIRSDRKTLLKLPDLGTTATWTTDGTGTTVRHTATLVNLQIEIEGVRETVFAIKEVSGRDIFYWAKGYGLVINETNNGIFMYNTKLSSLTYRESPVNVREIERQQQELDRQRAEAEQRERERLAEVARIEREAIEEEARQRKIHVDNFLAEREQKVYKLEQTNSRYNRNRDEIYAVIDAIIKRHNINNLSFTLTNKSIVDYNGNNQHIVQIEGLSNSDVINEIKQAVENLRFVPLTVIVPHTSEIYPVTSESEYVISHKVTTEYLKLKKKNDNFILKEGDELFFAGVKPYITNQLKDNGIYKLNVTESQDGNKNNVEVSILKYKKKSVIGKIGSVAGTVLIIWLAII